MTKKAVKKRVTKSDVGPPSADENQWLGVEHVRAIFSKTPEQLDEIVTVDMEVIEKLGREVLAHRSEAARLEKLMHAVGCEQSLAGAISIGQHQVPEKPVPSKMTLDRAIEMVVRKEAWDLLRLSEAKTWTEAVQESYSRVRKRYVRGRCSLCNRDGLECAKRHAKGRSCA